MQQVSKCTPCGWTSVMTKSTASPKTYSLGLKTAPQKCNTVDGKKKQKNMERKMWFWIDLRHLSETKPKPSHLHNTSLRQRRTFQEQMTSLRLQFMIWDVTHNEAKQCTASALLSVTESRFKSLIWMKCFLQSVSACRMERSGRGFLQGALLSALSLIPTHKRVQTHACI